MKFSKCMTKDLEIPSLSLFMQITREEVLSLGIRHYDPI